MKRRIQLLLVLFLLAMSQAVWAQGPNLIWNPSFEDGPVVTGMGQIGYANYWNNQCTDAGIATPADVFDAASTFANAGVPSNIYGYQPARPGSSRYAHIYARASQLPFWGFESEGIKGTLVTALPQGCYDFQFYAVSDNSPFSIADFSNQMLEITLVSGASCTGKVIYTSPSSIPNNGVWNEYNASFTISAMEAGVYDRILIRVWDDGINYTSDSHRSMYLDDFSITAGGGTLPITADVEICPGESTTLSTMAGFDNYLWSNGANTPSTTVSSPGTYTVEAWNDGSNCHSTASVTVTLHDLPNIEIPNIVYACNEMFPIICGPTPPAGGSYSYQWWGPHPVDPISVLLGTSGCFVPDDYGSYLLIVTDDVTGCTVTHNFSVQPTPVPSLSIRDVYYCEAAPRTIGTGFPVTGAVSYSWTYNGNPVAGATNYYLPNMGDGEYCVTVTYTNGCSNTTCFMVEQCCDPDPKFNFSFNLTGSPNSLTVSNDPANTPDYDYEQFRLYRYCGSETDPTMMTWSLVATMGRYSNFNVPYTFAGSMIQEGCWYKIVHNVSSDCRQMSYTYNQYHYAGSLRFTLSPNPVLRGEIFKVTLDSEVDGEALVEILDMMTGKVVLKGTVTNSSPFTGSLSSKSENTMYAVRVTSDQETVIKQLMVK